MSSEKFVFARFKCTHSGWFLDYKTNGHCVFKRPQFKSKEEATELIDHVEEEASSYLAKREGIKSEYVKCQITSLHDL